MFAGDRASRMSFQVRWEVGQLASGGHRLLVTDPHHTSFQVMWEGRQLGSGGRKEIGF